MTIESPWTERGELMEDCGEYGGDVQIGKAPGRRFTHTSLPGRVVDIYAYPIEADGPGDDEKSITIECQQTMTVCTNVADPGSTEVWSDITYVDLPERFDIVYSSAEAGEAGARALITSMEPHHIGWDGSPDISTARYRSVLPALSSQTDDAVERARAIVEWNNPEYGTLLDYGSTVIAAPDGSKWIVSWVFDTQFMPGADTWYGSSGMGGEVVACWWSPAPADCDACDNYREIQIFHASTDALIGDRPCPVCTQPKES